MPGGYVHSETLSATALGLSAVGLDAERTSNNIVNVGHNQLTVFVNHDANTSGAITISLNVDASNDGGTTWFPVQSSSVSSGTATLSDITYQKAVSNTDTYVVNIAVNYAIMRLRINASAAAGDTATVTARLGAL